MKITDYSSTVSFISKHMTAQVGHGVDKKSVRRQKCSSKTSKNTIELATTTFSMHESITHSAHGNNFS